MTDIPLDDVYLGVVSLRGLRTIIFISELNGLEVMTTDIGNAYLESITEEKVCVRAGPEFGIHNGNMLVINKEFYGLCTSGLRWHERLSDCLHEMNFLPSKS